MGDLLLLSMLKNITGKSNDKMYYHHTVMSAVYLAKNFKN